MANEVYIKKASGTAYQIDLGPVHMVEDTYVKTPIIESIPTDPGEGDDPETGLEDTKQTIHRFVITGVVPETVQAGNITNGITTVEQTGGDLNDDTSYLGRLRILYGYGSVTDTQLTFNYNGVSYEGFMTRLTLTRAGGEGFYEYIIELIEAVYIDDLSY